MKIFVKEKSKIRIFLYGSMLIAIVLGVYSQDVAYFLHNSLTVPLMTGLSTAMMLSTLLFFSPPILISKLNKKHKVSKKEFSIYLVLTFY